MQKNHKLPGSNRLLLTAVSMIAAVLIATGCSRTTTPSGATAPKTEARSPTSPPPETVSGTSDSKLRRTPPKVLIVSLTTVKKQVSALPSSADGRDGSSEDIWGKYVPGIRQLLAEHGIPVVAVMHDKVTPEQIHESDLVLVVGDHRQPEFSLNIDRPVLGIGCSGCGYFGKLHLKNGWPYT